ncbi:MAG: hypothetical protein L6R39_001682 [Caloplaca ligustica]|nr:MAG: hypothetical protein L6R39_001682 [Caloplaca ligustica]
MHVKIFGHPSGEISDLKALLPSCLNPDEECEVYGHLRCKQFAHPYGPTGVNPKVMQNADNYAWWATAEYFARKWNIRPTKFRAVRDITAADEGDMDTVNVAADDDFVKRVEDIPNPPDVDLAECEIDHADPQKPKMVCDGQGAFEPLPQDFPDPRAMANCPDPNPLLNLGQNPCDTKCNGAGYERCSQDLAPAENAFEDHKIPLIKFSCYCKDTPTQDSPCAGMKCGDPIKMRDGPIQEDGKPQFKAVRAHNGCITHPFAPPSMFACDVFCANGNYKECGKEKFLGHSACACSEGSCADFACVDAIKDYGEGGR